MTNGISHSFILSTGDDNKGVRDLLPGICRDKQERKEERNKETKEVRQQASKGKQRKYSCMQASSKEKELDLTTSTTPDARPLGTILAM